MKDNRIRYIIRFRSSTQYFSLERTMTKHSSESEGRGKKISCVVPRYVIVIFQAVERVDPTVFALGYLGIEMSRVSWPRAETREERKVGLSEYSRFQGLSCDSPGGSRWPARRLPPPLS